MVFVARDMAHGRKRASPAAFTAEKKYCALAEVETFRSGRLCEIIDRMGIDVQILRQNRFEEWWVKSDELRAAQVLAEVTRDKFSFTAFTYETMQQGLMQLAAQRAPLQDMIILNPAQLADIQKTIGSNGQTES